MNTIAALLQINDDADDLTEDAGGSIYQRIREEIITGSLPANARLKVSDLARRLGTSTNPIREALQQLRGEGFVVMSPNKGARVREVGEDFVRDTFEIELLIEPYLMRSFVELATDADIVALEALQDEMERLNFSDEKLHSALDLKFHRTMYDRHYNRHAVDMWWRHREILSAISWRFPVSLRRRANVMQEHRELIQSLKDQDAERAAATISRHVEGSGRHIIEQMRAARRQGTA